MLPYARLAPGAGFQGDRALRYFLQRLVTAPAARRAVADLIAANLRRRYGDGREWRTGAERPRVLAELRADGVSVLRPLMSKAAVARMAAYFMDKPVVAPDGRLVPVDALAQGVTAAPYDLETVLDCPNLMALLNAAPVLGIAAEYLGCKPTLSSVGVRWSLPTAGNTPRFQEFHRDVDDWRFLKFFVYLTDVDEGSGPHTYVKRTHASAFGPRAKAYAQGDIERRYGRDRLLTVTGPRGTTFMADTLGIHRGGRPTLRPRLILQAQYSLLPVYAFNYSPVERPGVSSDAYCSRLLLQA